jgi:hypothetical protein
MPAKAGIRRAVKFLDSRFHGNDQVRDSSEPVYAGMASRIAGIIRMTASRPSAIATSER